MLRFALATSLLLAACGGNVVGTGGEFDPTREYRMDSSVDMTSSGVTVASCHTGDVVMSGGCYIAGGTEGDDPNAWLTQNEQIATGWACAAWVGDPTTVAGRAHVLHSEVTCYFAKGGK